jgi:hypothetical protein
VKNKVGKRHSREFINGLKSLLNDYDFPIDKISDNDVEYLSAKKAININSTEKVSNSNGVYCIKFWFSLEKGFIGYTGVGNKKMKDFIIFSSNEDTIERNTMTESIYNHIKNELNIKTGFLTRVNEFAELENEDYIVACFDGNLDYNKIAKAKVYNEGNRVYAIQSVADGSTTDERDWIDWEVDGSDGNLYSWSLGSVRSRSGSDHSLLYKYTEGTEPLIISDFNKPKEENKEVNDSPFVFNLPLSRGGGLRRWSRDSYNHLSLSEKNWKDVEEADFAVVLYVDKMLQNAISNNFKKRSETVSDREESKKGALKFISDDDIKRANLKRYMGILVSKMGISEDSLDLKNLQKFIASTILGDYSYFSIKRDRPELNSYVIGFYENILNLMKSIKNEDRADDIKHNFDRVVNHYEHSNERSIEYRKPIDKNYNLFMNIKGSSEQFDLLKEYMKTCKDIGSYIKDYILSQEINSIEEYIFLCNKIESIRNVMNNNLFKAKSTPITHTLDKVFKNNVDVDPLVRYMESNPGDAKQMANDLKGLKNIEKYIKSILN